ncbi:hypothetical protein [Elizabethkingia miricola]|uniref:hypothetical protein n=1 Tax=Elizabethkingia miricola TaxID=172045 RepID=UPI0009992203|nr:hypothetical protein [Elizabethkingia miricola]OPC40695.1 hypothetical protein BAX99_02225 [Elizabethkingia miricola]
MLFLSAQPDSTYFIWQLEIQLRNFRSFKIIKEQIHIIIGYDTVVGLKEDFKKFIEDNINFAQFYIYPDTRVNSLYASSIRPHLLEKHWMKFPNLKNEIIFYYDSDILLTRKWNIEKELADHINYISNTRSYLDSEYILSHSNQNILEQMCGVVGIDSGKVIENDCNSGGAQYILKNIDEIFWRKVYKDSETIFELLSNYNSDEAQKEALNKNYKSNRIQAWCADMWGVLWNLWYYEKEVRIHSELDFSWPTEPIEQWHIKAIQHYSGPHIDKRNFFYKRDYVNHFPWYDDNLYSIPNISCSYYIVQHIKNRREELDNDRYILNNIELKFFNNENLVISKYISKYFKISDFNKGINLEFDDGLIIPPKIIIDLDDAFKNNNYNGILFKKVYKIDQVFGEVFSSVLDVNILILNKGKFSLAQPFTVQIDYKINVKENNILTIYDDVFLI